jgi:O-antigen/teichoic acid export membrane protein
MSDGLVKKVSSGLTFNLLRVVVSIATSLLYSIIAVRWLQAYNFGIYVFLDSIFSGLAIVYVLGLHSAQTRFIPEFMAKKDYPRLRRFVWVSQKINFISAFSTSLLIFAFADGLALLMGQPEIGFYIRLKALGIVPAAVLGIIKVIQNALYDQKFLSITGIFFSILDLSLLFLLVVVLELRLIGVILLSIISDSFAAILHFARLKSKNKILFDKEVGTLNDELKRRVAKYAVPLMLLDLFNYYASGPLQNLFLGFSKDMVNVTFFDVPYSFIQTVFSKIFLVIGGLGLISLVEIKTLDPTKLNSAIKQFTKLIALYVMPIMVGGFILAEPLLTVLYGQELLPAVFPFKILIITLGLSELFGMVGTVMLTFERSTFVLLLSVISFMLLTVLNFALIPPFGVIGATMAILAVIYIKNIVFTYVAIVKLKIGNFIPGVAIVKYCAASMLMGIFLFAVTNIFEIKNLISLFGIVSLGFFVYLFGLRIVRAFDQHDREILLRSNVPFKEVIVKLFA